MYKNDIKKHPKISIITVCLNSEKTIKRCLDSVINQNYPKKKIEYIVIDGGSDDKTLSIIKKKIKKIKYFHSKKDRGIYDAMNLGLKKCTGEVIGILNSDDYFFKNTFKMVTKYFGTSNIDYLFGSVIKSRVYHNFIPEKLWYTFSFYPSHSVSFFIKKKIQKKIGKYNTKFRYSADRDLFYRMIVKAKMKGKATNKKELIGYFNEGGFSESLNFIGRLLEETRIRLKNKQNIILIIILFFAHLIYQLRKFFIKEKKI